MQVEHHDLHNEFSQFRERIYELNKSDKHFARLCNEYTTATQEIERLEKADIPITDFAFEQLKKQRIKLKDQIYSYLSQSKK